MANFGYKTLGFGTNATAGYELPVVAGLLLHLRSDLGITKDGSNKVSSWLDQSPNAYELSQTTGSKQPIWVDSAVNGHPSIKFDGTGDVLQELSYSQVDPIHLFVVYKILTFGDLDMPLNMPNSVQILMRGDDNEVELDTGWGDGIPQPGVGNWNLLIGFGTSASNASTYAGKMAQDNNAYTNVRARSGTTTGILEIGSREDISRHANVEIAEFIAYEGEKIGDDLTNIKTYINNRYGLW